MRFSLNIFLLLSFLLCSARAFTQPPPPPPCVDGPDTICGQLAPEDLVALGSNWVAASAYIESGGVALVNTKDRSTRIIFPAENSRIQHDKTAYPTCPAPPPEGFQTHGLYVEPSAGPVYKLFAVAHGPRESIEVFNIDTSSANPVATWIGCVIAPDPIGLNSVRGLKDGGFITTNFQNRGEPPEKFREIMNGTLNAQIWEWHKDSGWNEVPGSEASGPNGIELSDDGNTLYVAAWGSQSFFTLTRGSEKPQRQEIELGFRVDNIHWSSDGKLWVVGQTFQESRVIKIDPETLAVTEVAAFANTPGFSAGTVAVEVGDSLWIGSYRGDRIHVIPAP